MKPTKCFSLLCLPFLIMIGAGAACGQNIIEVPCEFINNTIYLQVTINGTGPFLMTLDTGTNPSAINLATAQQLGLKLRSAKSAGKGFGSGKITTRKTKIARLEVAGIVTKGVAFEALDLSAASAKSDKPIVGLLGYSFLKGRILQIDYPHHKLRFYQELPFSRSRSQYEARLAMTFDAHVPVIDIFVEGKRSRALLDTGGSYELLLTPGAVTHLGLEKEFKEAKILSGGGYAGQQEIRLGHVSRLSIGSFTANAPDVVFATFGKDSPFKLAEGGLGTFFLKDFVITFDYRHKLIALRK